VSNSSCDGLQILLLAWQHALVRIHKRCFHCIFRLLTSHLIPLSAQLTLCHTTETLQQHAQCTNGVDDLRFVLMVARVALLDSEADVTGHASTPDLCLAAAHSESGCTVSVARVKDEDRAKCDRYVGKEKNTS
jgi:hypothetical protein